MWQDDNSVSAIHTKKLQESFWISSPWTDIFKKPKTFFPDEGVCKIPVYMWTRSQTPFLMLSQNQEILQTASLFFKKRP